MILVANGKIKLVDLLKVEKEINSNAKMPVGQYLKGLKKVTRGFNSNRISFEISELNQKEIIAWARLKPAQKITLCVLPNTTEETISFGSQGGLVRAFQRKAGLKETGNFDKEALEVLGTDYIRKSEVFKWVKSEA